jgi:hypothetical protein
MQLLAIASPDSWREIPSFWSPKLAMLSFPVHLHAGDNPTIAP